MDTKIEIKEEDPFPENVASQTETEFFTKNVIMKTNSDAMLVGSDFDMAIKTEIKSETSYPDFCSQKEKECFSKHLKQIKSETVTYSNICEIDTITGSASPNGREFLPKDPVIKVKKYDSDHEMDSNVQIKEEPCCLESETSFVCEYIKDENFTPIKSPRLCTEEASCDSPLTSTESSRKDACFKYGKECEIQKSIVTKMPHVKIQDHSDQTDKCKTGGNIYSKALLCHKSKGSHKCEICDKSFTMLSSLKRHNLIHEGTKPFKCELCESSFTRRSHLKCHYLIHEGKKHHKCDICEKRFTQLSYLKKHKLTHEGKKFHKCNICEKSFTQLSNMKRHKWIHEDKKPHKCESCEKSFTWLAELRYHSLMHEGKKLYKCVICEKNFTNLYTLKSHNLIHEGKQPYKCNICEKGFTHLSHLKSHILIHEGIKPHKCEICEKSFTKMSNLKRHNLIHKGKRPHKCEVCEKSFTRLSYLQRHNLTH